MARRRAAVRPDRDRLLTGAAVLYRLRRHELVLRFDRRPHDLWEADRAAAVEAVGAEVVEILEKVAIGNMSATKANHLEVAHAGRRGLFSDDEIALRVFDVFDNWPSAIRPRLDQVRTHPDAGPARPAPSASTARPRLSAVPDS